MKIKEITKKIKLTYARLVKRNYINVTPVQELKSKGIEVYYE